MAERSFVVDPRVFISPPYLNCPFCRAAGEFGVLMISSNGYIRRCRSCMKDKRFELPAIRKHVLYLDQFAVSNLMKVLHPTERERVRSKAVGHSDFWLDLFERLDRLVKLQLLVCPSSIAHWEESLPSPFVEELRRIYEHLSGGVSFEDPGNIRRAQVYEEFIAWLGDSPDPLTVHDVTHGDVNFDQELSTYGPLQWRSYLRRVVDVGTMIDGDAPFDAKLATATNDAQILVASFKETLAEHGVADEDQLPKISDFFVSDKIKDAPFLQISCAMFAAMAVEASMQQAPKPDRGMWTDITTVSTLLPYCDAMFIDNRCHRLLERAVDGAKRDFKATLFSTDSRDELLKWLDDLEASATPDHVATVRNVCGPGWLEPIRRS
jgi:hypothetical protein